MTSYRETFDRHRRLLCAPVVLAAVLALWFTLGTPKGVLRYQVTRAFAVTKQTAADVKSFIADADKAKAEAAYETTAAQSQVQKGSFAAKAKVMYKPAKKAGDTAPAAAAPPAEVYQTYEAR